MRFFPLSSTVAGLLAIVMFAQHTRAAEPMLAVDFDKNGEPVFTLDGKVISQPSASLNPEVRFRDPAFVVPIYGVDGYKFPADAEDGRPTGATFDRAKLQVTQTFRWGKVVRTYKVAPGGLDVSIDVHNTSDKTLFEFRQRLFTLKVPADSGPVPMTEATYFGQPAMSDSGDTLSGPVALPLLIPASGATILDLYSALGKATPPQVLVDSRALVATTSETQKHLALWWGTDSWVAPWNRKAEPRSNDPVAQDLADRAARARAEKGEDWHLMIAIGGDRPLFHNRPTSRPIAPGERETLVASLRVGNAVDPLAPAKPFLEAYGKARPMLFKWDDRRPIARTFIGDHFPFHEPTGPNMSRRDDIKPTPELREMVMKEADMQIARMKAIHAQGIIVWNIESNGYSYLKYFGEPSLIEYASPEANALADEYFKKYTDAGFKVGVCLRPSVIEIADLKKMPWVFPGSKTGFAYYHDYPHKRRSIADILSEKVEYAKKRWGCTLFYVDTNVGSGYWPETDQEKADWPKNADGSIKWYNEMIGEEVWAEVLRRHPDVLFTIEHTPLIQYTINAPYDEWKDPAGATPPVVRATWPDAFKMLVIEQPQGFWETIVPVSNGDILVGQDGFVEAVQIVSEFLKEGPPKDLATMKPPQLAAVIVDETSPRRTKFFALRKLGETGVDRATADKVFAGEDSLLKMLTLESFKTTQDLNDHLPFLIQTMEKEASTNGFLAAPIRDAIVRAGGDQFLRDLAVRARSTPAQANGLVDILYSVPGIVSTQGLLDVFKDSSQSLDLRGRAVVCLGWRKDASPEQRTEVLDLLLAMLDDPKLREYSAWWLRLSFVWGHGLWSNEPRVYEAAVQAAAAERAKPSPDAAFLVPLDKIIKREQ